jgi:hypothetical protein
MIQDYLRIILVDRSKNTNKCSEFCFQFSAFAASWENPNHGARREIGYEKHKSPLILNDAGSQFLSDSHRKIHDEYKTVTFSESEIECN